MTSWQVNLFWPTTDLSDLYDFSLPFAQRRGPALRRERNRYSHITPFTRPGNLYQRNRGFCNYGNGEWNRPPPQELIYTLPPSTFSENDDDENSVDNGSSEILDSCSDSESDESISISLEPDEEYANNYDIEIDVEDIGVDNEELDLSLNFENMNNATNEFQFNELSIEINVEKNVSLPRVFVRVDWVPLRQTSARDKLVVNKLIKHARYNKLPVMEELLCPDCKLVPMDPVTGQCGHTRCTKCITSHGCCPCGMPQPRQLHVNILINNIIEKMIRHYDPFDAVLLKEPPKKVIVQEIETEVTLPIRSEFSYVEEPEPRYFTMTLEARFALARRLIAAGYHIDATPHLAHIAAAQGNNSKHARSLLNECVSIVSQIKHGRYYTRKLYRSVRNLSAVSWLKKNDVECILCIDAFKDPVTTFCGHTYCRNCLLRSINYSKNCPLCKRSLVGLDLYEITETFFVASILSSIAPEHGPVTLEPDVVPIFMCAVAFPSVPCPLLVFDARYWQSLRRLLGKERREFGMVARHKDNAIPVYGTMLEVRDCVELRNGGSILTTVGTWRFKITETDFIQGCDVARIERLSDVVPEDRLKISCLQISAAHVALKAKRWLRKMDARIHSEIESVYGNMPVMGCDITEWWQDVDGPDWLWWLISILPLKSQIKILILSAQCVMKRLIAVDLTLNAIEELCKIKQPRSSRKTVVTKKTVRQGPRLNTRRC